MFVDFDIHEKSNMIAILQFLQDGNKNIVSYNLKSNEICGEVTNNYLPLGPRLSPNGRQLAFCSNNPAVFVLDFNEKTIEFVFNEPDLKAGFCEWSYDGISLCFSAHSVHLQENTPPNIYAVNLKTQEAAQLTDSEGIDRFPQWSPSGKYIAFHRQYPGKPHIPKRIFIVNTGTKRCGSIPHSEGVNHQIGRYCWSSDSLHLLVQERNGEKGAIKVFQISTMELVCSISYPEITGGVFLPRSDEILLICKKEVLILSFPDGQILRKHKLPDGISVQGTLRGPSVSLNPDSENIFLLNANSCIYKLDKHGSFTLLYEDNSGEHMPAFKHEEYFIHSCDGRSVPIHTFIPNHPKDTGILFLHGGPGERVDDPEDPLIVRLLEEQYEVIVPAYRGCSGYGKEHQEANHGEYGRADVWDVVAAGLDWKRKTQNKRPLAVMGYSYGGYLTLLALAFPDPPWDCGITLWAVTRIEHLKMHLPKSLPADQKERMIAEKERNPVEQAKNITVPLLILHGDQDTTSTTEEVVQIQKKVLSYGGVCELVIYDDAHGLGKHRREMFKCVFNFLNPALKEFD